MVRLYCLTRIYKIEPNKYYNGEKVIPYPDGSDENLFTGIKEGLTAAHILELNFSRYYELTEISIGYEFVNDRKVFVMHFYRDDTRLCVIRMIRGAVRFHKPTRNALDLTISTSTLFGKVDLDLFMRIRWRGAVRFHQTTRNALDLTISTSTLFCGKVDLDLFMRIRWVKPSPTGPNIIDKTEEKRYREFAEERKNEEISNYYRGL
uniref:Uncharacterized protein n=1 Tax=Panagrolaimus sp. ES5 TaxID=591445 RepID=A0AC34FZ52_9BILA